MADYYNVGKVTSAMALRGKLKYILLPMFLKGFMNLSMFGFLMTNKGPANMTLNMSRLYLKEFV